MTEEREGYAVSWSARHICAPSGSGWSLAHERPLREVFLLAGGGPTRAAERNDGEDTPRPSACRPPYEVRL